MTGNCLNRVCALFGPFLGNGGAVIERGGLVPDGLGRQCATTEMFTIAVLGGLLSTFTHCAPEYSINVMLIKVFTKQPLMATARYLFVLACSALVGTAWSQQLTGADLQKMLDASMRLEAGNPEDGDVELETRFGAYAIGVVDALTATKILCVPKGIGISEYRTRLKNYLSTTPAFTEKPAAGLFFYSLPVAYRCRKSG